MTTDLSSISPAAERTNSSEAELFASNRLLQSTLDALTSHIAILDEHGTILGVNAPWNRFAVENDYRSERHGVGENYLKICESAVGNFSEGASAVASGIREVMAGQCGEFHSEYSCHSPQEERWFVVRVTRFSGPGPVKVVVAHAQITEHIRSMEHFRRALAHERELSELKSRFVGMVSHEFRTPLCVINGGASLLECYSDQMTAEERRGHLKEIQKAVARMTEMMEDLLLHGKFDTAKIECNPSRIELETFCRQLISEVASDRTEPCSIACEIEPSVREVFLDEKLLRHILGNLLCNAVKYSAPGQPVSLSLRRTDGSAPAKGDAKTSRQDYIQFKFMDSGIGIPAADLSKLFQTFHRAANVGNRPGTGMGLAIVKRCVDLHRGTIRVESEEGKGTTVLVWLPILSPEATGGSCTRLKGPKAGAETEVTIGDGMGKSNGEVTLCRGY
jgi:signal transduction histidine kinase